MKVRDVMTAPVVSVGPDAPYAQIVHLMLAHDVSGLPVLADDGRLLGIVTEADLMPKEAYTPRRRRRVLGVVNDLLHGHDPLWASKAAGRTAADVMTEYPVTVGPDDDLAQAAQRMISWSCKRLPVVEEGRVVGMLSRRDVLRLFQRSDATVLAQVSQRLADLTDVPAHKDVTMKVVNGVVTLEGSVRHASDAAKIESIVARVDGVVGVDNRLTASHRPATG